MAALALKVGDLVFPQGSPDQLYRVTSRVGVLKKFHPFRLLPYRRSGAEIIIWVHRGQWTDGTRLWIKL
jgi:hypothetical protein